MRRVVVTGMGLVTPLGCDVDTVWKRLINGDSGVSYVTSFDTTLYPCKIGGIVLEKDFNPDDYVPKKDQRKTDIFMVYAMCASMKAVEDSGWEPSSDYERERTGVIIGSGIGGLSCIEKGSILLEKEGSRRILGSPFFIPSSLVNLAAGNVSVRFGFKGPNHAVATACATGSHAIGDAMRMIQLGIADVMVSGSAEAAICPVGYAGFASARALSTNYNDTPEKASRPWDKDRDGFVMGEGAGILILEEYEHAKKRGAKIYGEVIGYGLSGDAHHITSPPQDGEGGYRAMKMALETSGLSVTDIDYVNAHGTSTPVGDIAEALAIKRLFGSDVGKISVSSTKSSIGHLLGASGSVEAIFSILSMLDNKVPPTLNLENPEEECLGIDLVPKEAKDKKVNAVMSNSFGFGGTNASLVFKKV